MVRKQHQVRRTLLIVGEGDSEKAFLRHLRSLYCAGGAGLAVTVCNAHGKGPENVVNHAARQTRVYSYDECVVLLDTDIPWTDKLKKDARKARVEMIGSIPCFEGLLLSILGKRPPSLCTDCKKSIRELMDIDLTESQGYARHFPKAILDAARAKIVELDRLLKAFEGSEG